VAIALASRLSGSADGVLAIPAEQLLGHRVPRGHTALGVTGDNRHVDLVEEVRAEARCLLGAFSRADVAHQDESSIRTEFRSRLDGVLDVDTSAVLADHHALDAGGRMWITTTGVNGEPLALAGRQHVVVARHGDELLGGVAIDLRKQLVDIDEPLLPQIDDPEALAEAGVGAQHCGLQLVAASERLEQADVVEVDRRLRGDDLREGGVSLVKRRLLGPADEAHHAHGVVPRYQRDHDHAAGSRGLEVLAEGRIELLAVLELGDQQRLAVRQNAREQRPARYLGFRRVEHAPHLLDRGPLRVLHGQQREPAHVLRNERHDADRVEQLGQQAPGGIRRAVAHDGLELLTRQLWKRRKRPTEGPPGCC
jgi:hypothetical protein